MSYISHNKKTLLDSLENQVLYANIVCLLVGDKGIGKSFLVNELRDRVKGEVFISEIQGQVTLSSAQLEKTICLQLGLSWQSGQDTLVQKISTHCNRRVLITIDDADQLPDECLAFLLALISEQIKSEENRMFVVLAGTSVLVKKLSDLQQVKENPELCAIFELQGIEPTETAPLLAALQNTSITNLEAMFEPQKIQYFWQLSHGNPANLAYQLQRYLSQVGQTTERKETQSAKGGGYISALLYGVIAVILTLTLIYQDKVNQWFESEEKTALVQDIPSAQETNDAVNVIEEQQLANKADANSVQVLEQEPQSTAVKVSSEQESQQSKVETSDTESNISINSSDSAKKQTKPEDIIPSDVQSDKTDSSSLNTSISDEKQEMSFQVSDKLTEDAFHLLSLDDKAFVLQWVALSDMDSALVFTAQHPLKSQMKIYQRDSNGRKLFLIVSGLYNSKIDASNAKEEYSKRQYPGKPWVKSVATIKQEMKR